MNNKNTLIIGGTVVAVVVLLFLLNGLGKTEKLQAENSKLAAQNKALVKVAQLYGDICKATNGNQAAGWEKQMIDIQTSSGLNPDEFPLKPRSCVKEAYMRQATTAYANLRSTKKDDRRAAALADEYRRCVKQAERDVAPGMERQLALEVARNKKEVGFAIERAHSATPKSPARPHRRQFARR